MSADVNNNLNEILDIEPTEPPEEKMLGPDQWSNLGPPPPLRAVNNESKELVIRAPLSIMGPTNENETQEARDDFAYGRDVFRELIEKGTVTIDDLAKVAKASEEPRAYEVVAQLIKTTAETTKELLDLHKRHKNLKADTNKRVHEPRNYEEPSINVERAVFVGTTKDLLQKVKTDRDNANVNNSE